MKNLEAERISVGWIDPGYVHGAFAKGMAIQLRDMQYHGCAGKVARVSSSLPLRARNKLIEHWLKDDDSPWIWLVDADMYFDEGHVMKLWQTASEYGVKMVSGLAFIFNDGQPSPSFFLSGDQQEGFHKDDLITHPGIVPETPIEIAASGLATVLIHRDVFEAMQPDFHTAYRWFHTNKLNYQGEVYGEDTQFFVRAQRLGFKHMLEPRATSWHIKEIAVGLEDWKKAWGKNE